VSASVISGGSELAGTPFESSAVLTVRWSASGETDAGGVAAAAGVLVALELLELEDELPLDPQPATASAPARSEHAAAVASVRCPRNPCARLSADMVDLPSC
jgi:hypothetical protein